MKRTIAALFALAIVSALHAQDANPTPEATPAPVVAPSPSPAPASTDFSVIGKSIDELRARYGKEVKSEPSWTGVGTAYGFNVGSRFVYVIVGNDGKVNDAFFIEVNPLRKLTAEEAAKLFSQNGAVAAFKGHFDTPHIDAKSGLVGNYGPINKPTAERLGFQVRTLDQYTAEQAVVKKMTAQAIADWKKAHPAPAVHHKAHKSQ